MLCLECNHPAVSPGLVIAMEQRQHVALERQAEVCQDCASKVYRMLNHAGHCSRYWSQCVNCALCGGKLPAIRLRFDLKHTGLRHIALCSKCYSQLRTEMLQAFPNLVSWVEKEWETTETSARRMPWARGTVVRVRPSAARYRDQVGVVESCRGLVQPWFGYDVRFDERHHHFFHERDLEPVSAVPVQAAPQQAAG